MHLYRIITNIRAGLNGNPQVAAPRYGIATIWVKANSMRRAMEQGREILRSRRYAHTGEPTIFREENTHVETESAIEPRDGLAAGYTALKLDALRRRNGLFEVWFPAVAN